MNPLDLTGAQESVAWGTNRCAGGRHDFALSVLMMAYTLLMKTNVYREGHEAHEENANYKFFFLCALRDLRGLN